MASNVAYFASCQLLYDNNWIVSRTKLLVTTF